MDPVEEIKSRIDIVDVISKHVELKRAGRNYKARCPFHQEKTPSFVVFPETQTWRCFGACAEGGDVYSFLMKKNGWDFGETLRSLAAETGVQLGTQTPEQAKKKEAHARLYELLDTATLYYMHLLQKAPEAEAARAYVAERGLLPHIVEQFQLGYALDQWDGVRRYLTSKGFEEETLLATGLMVEKQETGRRYDRFRGRLMIPIRDIRGRVVGFGARGLEKDAIPKYLNSPQTDLFDKSTLLFGLDMAKKSIRDADQVIIVEGYMDVMQSHQAGHANIVAQMGTALTDAQLRQLKRYTRRLVLALDSDAAGQKATFRGLDVARQSLDRQVEVTFDPRGLVRHEARLKADIRIATLPEGFDPDKLIKKDDAAWITLLNKAKPVVEFIIDSIVANVDVNDAKSKSEAASRAAPIISDMANPVERDHYTQYLARQLRIDERTLAEVVSRRSWKAPRRQQSSLQPPPPPNWESDGAQVVTNGERRPKPTNARGSSPTAQELYCLNQLIALPATWRQADHSLEQLGVDPICTRDFSDSFNQTIFGILQQFIAEGSWQTDLLSLLEERLDESLHSRLRAIQTQRSTREGVSTEKVAEDLAYTILRMRKEKADQAKRDLDSVWSEDLGHNDQTVIGEYFEQVIELQARRLEIDRALDSIVNPVAGNHERNR